MLVARGINAWAPGITKVGESLSKLSCKSSEAHPNVHIFHPSFAALAAITPWKNCWENLLGISGSNHQLVWTTNSSPRVAIPRDQFLQLHPSGGGLLLSSEFGLDLAAPARWGQLRGCVKISGKFTSLKSWWLIGWCCFTWCWWFFPCNLFKST